LPLHRRFVPARLGLQPGSQRHEPAPDESTPDVAASNEPAPDLTAADVAAPDQPASDITAAHRCMLRELPDHELLVRRLPRTGNGDRRQRTD
jgi:hypothetical protein